MSTQIERAKIVPLADQLDRELDSARRESLERQELIEPSAEEKRNGWTAQALTEYLAECMAGQALAVDVNSLHRRMARRPQEQNHEYNPHRWRA